MVNLNISNQMVRVVPNEVPVNQPKTQQIFKNLGFEPPKDSSNLKNRCSTLAEMSRKLVDVESTEKRNKIIAVVASIFAVAVLATAVLALTVGTGGVAAAVGVSCILGYLAISAIYNYASSDEKPGWLKMLASPIIGPFMPVFKAFTKVPFLKADIKIDSQEIGDKFVEMSQFYRTNREAIHGRIDQEIEKITRALEFAEAQEIRSPAGEQEYRDMLRDYTNAKEDLDNNFDYFTNFLTDTVV